MDKGWTQLPLFVIFLLFLSNTHGFKAGAHSDVHHWWGQPSDKTFSPRAVQSSVSEVPVTGTLPEEVGSGLFTNRPLKRLNLLKFVKGGVSSRHESISHAQTAPSRSVLASLPLNERYAGHLTSLQGSSGSAATDTNSVSTQGQSSFPATLGDSGQSTSDQGSPSLYMSSSLETSGAKSAEATLPVFSQESISYSSSSAPGATHTSQGSPVLASEGSGQSNFPQGESRYSGLSQSQGASDQYNPGSHDVLSSLSVSSQSTSDQSTPSLYSYSFQGSSGSLLEASGSSFQGEVAGMGSHVDLSPQSQDPSSQLLPSPLEVSSQSTNGQSTPSLFKLASESSSDSQSPGPASPLDTQGSLTQSISSQPTSVQSSPSVSTSTQSRSGTQFTSSNFFPVQGGGSSSSLYLKPQVTLGLYAPASHPKYVSLPMSSQPAIYSQSKNSSGPWSGVSTGFASQGMSSTYSGYVQSQDTSQFASGSPSYYPSASLSSPQGASSQSATAQSSQKQFSSSYGTQLVSSKPFTLQGSTTYGGSLQPQGTASQFASGSPSSYPSVSLSSPQGSSSQSATGQSSQKQFSSSYGTQAGTSKPFTLQGSTTYGGSLQPQGTTSQFASGSPSSYPSVSLSSPQGSSSQSATGQSSQKQFASSYGTQLVSSKPFTLQGSTTYGGSLQPQGTTSQFASGSPSSYPSVSLSSPQGASSQFAAVQSSQKQFASSYGTQLVSSKPFTLQGSTTYGGSLQPQGTTSQFASGSPSSYPSVSLSSPQGSSSQSAAVLSSRKQFASSYGTQAGTSKPFTLQGSTTYGGSLQPQGTTSQFESGSPSYYPSASLSSPQGASSQSATGQSSQKQLASSYGTQLVSSKPFTQQGSTTYGGSLQPQGTTSQFSSGSPSSYPSVSLSSPQGASSQFAAVQSSQKQFASSYGTQAGTSKPFTLQGSTTYGGSLQPQGTASQFASGSPSSYPSVSLSSPQGASSQFAAVQSSQKQFASSYGTQLVSSKPFTLQGSTTYGGSLRPQGTTSQFASGSPSSYPSVSLSSPQGASSQFAAVQSSQKQFASSYGTQLVSSKPFTLQGSTTYGGSLQPQGTTSQFASGSPSSYPSVSLSSPQGSSSQSAAVLSSRKQFASSYGTQAGTSKPFTLQGSTTYGGSLQPQGTTSQFESGSPSYYPSASLSSPQGASSQSATGQSSQKQLASSYGTQLVSSKPFTQQGSTTYGGSLQPQGTTSQFSSGSPSSYPSVSLSSPQGASSQFAAVQSSQKQFASSYGTQAGTSKPFTLQGSTTYGGSLQPQGTASQFASGSPSSYPSVSLSSPQGASSQFAAVQSSQKQFASSYGTQLVSSKPFTLQGSTTYGGSLQPQGTTSQFESGSPSYYPSASLSSPQGASSQSATGQSSQKQLASSYGTQLVSSKPFTQQGSTTYGGSLQPQGTTSQFSSGSPSYYPSVSHSLPQGVADQSSQAVQSYSGSQSQKSHRWQPSRGIHASGAAASQGSSLSQSSPMQSLFPSLSSAGGSSSGYPGPFVSAQGSSSRYGGFSLHSQSPSSKYTPGSHALAKLGSSPLAVSSQSTSDKRSNGLYSSDSLRTQGLIGVIERPSWLSSQAPSYSSSNQISEHFGTMQLPTGSNLTPSLGLSAQASSVGMFSGIPQTAHSLRESGSNVQLYNQPFVNQRYSVKG